MAAGNLCSLLCNSSGTDWLAEDDSKVRFVLAGDGAGRKAHREDWMTEERRVWQVWLGTTGLNTLVAGLLELPACCINPNKACCYRQQV